MIDMLSFESSGNTHKSRDVMTTAGLMKSRGLLAHRSRQDYINTSLQLLALIKKYDSLVQGGYYLKVSRPLTCRKNN